MKKLLIVCIVLILLLSACEKSYGAYWEFGKSREYLFKDVFLESKFDCVVEPIDTLFSATCTSKNTKDVYNMIVPYYMHGEDWRP